MNALEGLAEFQSAAGKDFRYIRYIKEDIIQVWEILRDNSAEQHLRCRGLWLSKEPVEVEILQNAGIWNDLPKDVQKQLEGHQEEVKQVVADKMANARKQRKKKYDGLPEFLECKCGAKVKANYSYLQKKADAKKVPMDDLIKGYQCQTCNPTKGKKKKLI